MKLLESGDGFRTESLNVVCRHQRDRPDMKRSRACPSDFQSRVVAVARYIKAERELAICWAKVANPHRLPVACVCTTDESDTYQCIGVQRRIGPRRLHA